MLCCILLLMTAPFPHTYPCGDSALTVVLGDGISADTHQKVMALFACIKKNPPAGLRDVIPAYHSLTLVYDVVVLKKKDPSLHAYEQMRSYVDAALQKTSDVNRTSRTVNIPVCYDASLAPDLGSLAASHGIAVEEVIRLHTSKTYRVYMIGFLPGFAYMGSVDEKINTPRKTSPRTLVPAGSVGIAGEQTGIYPFDSPGGWQLIGQTPLKMFDAGKEMPCFLQPGDEVCFYPVPLHEFYKIKNA